MEVTLMGRIYPAAMKIVAKRELVKLYSSLKTKVILKNTAKEYKAILKRSPNMGGKENTYLPNMYLGAYLIALYGQIESDVTLEDYQNMILHGLSQFFILKFVAKRRDYFSEKAVKKRQRDQEWAEEKKEIYLWTWQLRFDMTKKEGAYWEFTQCGLCCLCKAEGVEALLPLMCKTDFTSIGFSGNCLIREKTLAQGDECCDFWILPDKKNKLK